MRSRVRRVWLTVVSGVLPWESLPRDFDTFATDNSDAPKQGVGRTCAGVDGNGLLAAYLGSSGFRRDLVPRPGGQHSAKHADGDLRRIMPMAQRVVPRERWRAQDPMVRQRHRVQRRTDIFGCTIWTRRGLCRTLR